LGRWPRPPRPAGRLPRIAEETKRRSADEFLAHSGVWLLLLAGVLEIFLAVAIRRYDALASVLAGFGCSSIVLALVLPRMQGAFKIGLGGVEANLKDAVAERVKKEVDLEPDDREELREESMREASRLASHRALLAGAAAAGSVIADYAVTKARLRAQVFEQRVLRWLTEQGYNVSQSQLDQGVDFIAQAPNGDVALVEAKLSTAPIEAQALSSAIRFLEQSAAKNPQKRYVLVLSTPELTPAARAAAKESSVEVWLETEPAKFERVN
jgi:hypothetical protein